MKSFAELLGFIAFIILAVGVVRCSDIESLEREIRKSEPFMFQNKEWVCGYTSRQVDINILEEKIRDLKK